MKPFFHLFYHLLSLLLLLTFYCSSVGAIEFQIMGDAVNIKTGEVVYTERHAFYEKDGKRHMLSSYVTTDSAPIGERTVVFGDDQVDSYVLSQTSYPRKESITRKQNALAFMKDEGTKKEKLVKYDPQEEVIVDAGFSNYIMRNWNELRQGKVNKFLFASSARMNIVKLQIKFTELIEDAQAGQAIAMFEMTAANPLFRLLLTPIKVGYYQDSKQLAYYRGISNLLDKDGKSFDIEIEFPESLALNTL